MAVIPSPDQRNRPVTTGTQGVVKLPGVESTVDAMQSVVESIDKIKETRDRDELAKAKLNYTLVKTEQDTAYKDDPDFKTIPERWKKNLSEARAVAAQSITDPRVRESFLMETEADMAVGEQRIVELAGNKAKDWERGQINEEMDILRNQAMLDDADIGYINQVVQERLQAAADRGVIDQEQAQATKRKFTNDLAIGRLKMMTPQERIKAFDQSWVKNLPIDTQTILKKETKEELRLGVAQEAAMELVDKEDITKDEAARILYKKFKNDPEQYQIAKQQFDLRFRDAELSVIQRQAEAYDSAFELLDSGVDSTMLKATFRPLWESLSTAQKKDIYAWEASKAAGITRQRSDMDVVDELNRLAQDPKKGVELARFYNENRNKLSDTDAHYYSKLAAVGVVGQKIDPLMSASSELTLRTKGWPPERTNQLLDWFKKSYFSFTNREKREPTADELNEMIDNATKEAESGHWYKPNKYRFEMDMEDKLSAIEGYDDFRTRMAFASSFPDPDVQARLTLKTYELEFPKLYQQIMDSLEGQPKMTDYELVQFMTRKLREQVDNGSD